MSEAITEFETAEAMIVFDLPLNADFNALMHYYGLNVTNVYGKVTGLTSLFESEEDIEAGRKKLIRIFDWVEKPMSGPPMGAEIMVDRIEQYFNYLVSNIANSEESNYDPRLLYKIAIFYLDFLYEKASRRNSLNKMMYIAQAKQEISKIKDQELSKNKLERLVNELNKL